MGKRPTDARPRPRLDRGLIVQTAISLLDQEGLAGLTTRALAARLEVQSPALYWYVRDKNELLDLVADAICAPILDLAGTPTADAGTDWRARLEAGMRAYRSVLHSHRDAPRLLAERPPVGPARRRLADAAVGLVLEAGFPEAEAALISLVLSDFVISIVSEEIRLQAGKTQAPPGEPERNEPGENENPADASEYRNLARITPHLATVKPDDLFEAGLGILLDGIQSRLTHDRAAPRASRP